MNTCAASVSNAVRLVPFKSIASAYNVPSKYPSLNSKLDVPKSMSLSVVGLNTPSANTICSVPAISNLIISSSELSST